MKKFLLMVLGLMMVSTVVFASPEQTATQCVANAQATATTEANNIIATATAVNDAGFVPTMTYVATLAIEEQATNVAFCDEQASYTPTSTFTITPTVTPTFTSTAVPAVIKNASYLIQWADWSGNSLMAWWVAKPTDMLIGTWVDLFGNSVEAVHYGYVKASACAGRSDTVGEAEGFYSAGHSLITKFKADSRFVQETKRINLILAPSAQATAGALYKNTLTMTYTPLLTEATTHLDLAAAITGTVKADGRLDKASKLTNKLKNDYNFIDAVATWTAGH
jgi:hypothetical protein